MPKAFTERENELIKNRLVELGYKQFSTYGMKKTNVEEIATAAGISKGAFYNFYESKEALFMDVAELAEQRFRQELLAVIDLPGPSPRARLTAVFKKAFDLLKIIPVLQFLTGNDFDLLLRRVPQEKFQEHMANDRIFLDDLIARCRAAGISIRVPVEELAGLLYPLVMTGLQQNDLGPNYFNQRLDLLLELIAAYCLGEIEVQSQQTMSPKAQAEEGN